MQEVITTKLTDWANPPKVSDLKQDYREATTSHSAHTVEVDNWLDHLNITGQAKLGKRKGKSTIQPKLIRKQAEWRYAALSEPFLSTEDVFNTDPISFEDKESAIQNGLILNNQFNTKIDKINFIDTIVRTLVDEGTAIVRVGWTNVQEIKEVEIPVTSMMPILDNEQAASMIQQGLPPLQEEVTGTELVKQLVTVANHPTVEVCNYKDVIIDPTAEGDIEKANFVIYSFETSLSELKKDGRYKNLDNINVEGNSTQGHPNYESTADFTFNDAPRKKFVAFEYWGYWDYEGTGIVKPFVATWVGDTLIRMEENPFPDEKLPFVLIQYLPRKKHNYGEPDGELLIDNQKVIGAVTRGMIDSMARSANGQMGSRKDALDVTNKRKFDRGLDYEFNPNVDPNQAFHMHTYPEIPRSAHEMLQLQSNEAESISGVKAFSQGISGNSLGKTATGIKSALDATSKRELGILRRLAEGIKRIGRKFISMNAVFLSEEEVVRITNDEFVTVRRDDLAGNIDISLTISTAEADNDKAEELSFMLQTLGNTMPPEFTQIILTDFATLRKMPYLAKKIKEFEPKPDPIAEQKAQLEVAMLQAELQEKQADIAVKQANAQYLLAKARTEGSTADLKDLDYVEQEEGVNQERELEKLDRKQNKQVESKK
jgi:hypothetical protein